MRAIELICLPERRADLPGARGRPDPALPGSARINNVELHFKSHYRPQSKLGESIDHLSQHVARVTKEWLAVMISHADLDLCNIFIHPRRTHERVMNRDTRAIGVAVVESEARGLDCVTEGIHRKDGAGESERAGIHRRQRIEFQPLAAGC